MSMSTSEKAGQSGRGWMWSLRAAGAALALLAAGARADQPPAELESIPGTVNYQATLKYADGSNYSNGVYNIEFRLYPASSGGADTALWGANYSVYVKDGAFGVMLGSAAGQAVSPAPTHAPTELWKAVWYNKSDPQTSLFLGMKVLPASAESVPRQQFLCAPFALRAHQALYASKSAGDFAVNGNVTVSNVTVSGGITATGLNVSGALTGSGASLSGVAKLAGGNAFTGNQGVSNDLAVGGGLTVTGTTSLNALSVTNTFAIKGKRVPVAEENLRIVRGIVKTGVALVGTGYSVTRVGTGYCRVTFEPAFSDEPAVVVTPWINYDAYGNPLPMTASIATTSTTSNSVVRIYTFSGTTLSDTTFHFIATGR